MQHEAVSGDKLGGLMLSRSSTTKHVSLACRDSYPSLPVLTSLIVCMQ